MEQYEQRVRLHRRYIQTFLAANFRRRPLVLSELKSLHDSRILPDVESSMPFICRSLLPAVHKLKWSIQKDKIAMAIRRGVCGALAGKDAAQSSSSTFGSWLEHRGHGIIGDSERVRLAICPGIKKLILFYETTAQH